MTTKIVDNSVKPPVVKVLYQVRHNRIRQIEISRETESSLWIIGTYRGKEGEPLWYSDRELKGARLMFPVFDTWEQARSLILTNSQRRLEAARKDLAACEQDMQEAQLIPEHKPVDLEPRVDVPARKGE